MYDISVTYNDLTMTFTLQTVGRRMTSAEFIENLAELNDGENFSKEILRTVYQSIKLEPIEWAL